MKTAEILNGILRRWYVVAIGLAVSVGGSLVAWNTVPLTYERSASLLLMPGTDLLPEGATNPYLYLGGLSTSADILARASSSQDSLNDLQEKLPGVEFTVSRDYSTSAPVVSMTVEALTDAKAATAIDLTIESITSTLASLQDEQSIDTAQRISLQALHVDTEGTRKQRTRLTAVAATGLGLGALSLAAAALVDGLYQRQSRRVAGLAKPSYGSPGGSPDGPPDGPPDDDSDRHAIRIEFDALLRSRE